MRLRPSTLDGIRKVAMRQLTSACQIQNKSKTTAGALGGSRPLTVFEVIASDHPRIQAFYEHARIEPGQKRFPCRLQSIRAEDMRQEDISNDHLLFWLYLPWYMMELELLYREFLTAPQFSGHILAQKTSFEVFSTGISTEKLVVLNPDGESDESNPGDGISLGMFEVEQTMAYADAGRGLAKALCTQRTTT